MKRPEIETKLARYMSEGIIHMYSTPYPGKPKWEVWIKRDEQSYEFNGKGEIEAFIVGVDTALSCLSDAEAALRASRLGRR